ncbi:aspartate kinase [Peptoniphilus catoniae]|uniref:aspartate kinase n=1 Tax=Peptoniphilus catoniae TaxID=1660341 RepID=UPI0010FD6C66|nr:aspartate kinase [Peptoniphilus catoniae]
MTTKVMKFGGSSLSTSEKIKNVAKILVRKKGDLNNIVCVVSAMGDTTDNLIALAKSLSSKPDRREMDQLLATGETISISLLAMAIEELGEKAISLTGPQAGFQVKGRYGFGKIVDVKTDYLEKKLAEGYIVIVAGFQGLNAIGDIMTLGRGGSDTSAVALAAKLKCDCEIYTDVAGVYTVDPRIHKTARKLEHLSYLETMEMAHLGAKVIDPRAVEIAQKYGVRLYIALNTANVMGTYIDKEQNVEQSIISNISIQDNILLVDKKLSEGESISDLFSKLAGKDINIDVISQRVIGDDNYISFTSLIDEKDLISEISEDFSFRENVSKVSIIGNGMRNQPGVAAKVFSLFNANKIDFYQVSTSEISISYIIDTKNKEKVIKLLVKEFDL